MTNVQSNHKSKAKLAGYIYNLPAVKFKYFIREKSMLLRLQKVYLYIYIYIYIYVELRCCM